MKEVSCRILEMFFRELEEKGLPPEVLIDGVGYPRAHFEDKHERIEWSAFVRLMENAQQIWTEEEIVAMGGAWIDSPFLRHIRLIAGALFTPKQFYNWLASDKAKRRGGGDQMFTCTTTTFTDLGPDRLAVEVRIDEGYESCPAFFLLTKGGFRDIPRLVGKPRATVVMSLIERGARFEVILPPGSDRVNPVRRAMKWLTSPAVAARELDDAHEALRARYEQLETARAKLALQAAQLRTAHTVNELIQRSLDLDLVLAAIASALVEEAGFPRARVDVDVDVDGLEVVRSVERGDATGPTLERVLERAGGHQLGTLTVYLRTPQGRAEGEELLAFIVPSIAMALDNAISYLVVEEYRRGLERRVKQRTTELTEALDALAGTVHDLERANEVRDRIFANINHDLRSPLSLILLAVDEARNAGTLTTDAERTLGTIEHGARRILRMVDELLVLAEGREHRIGQKSTRSDFGEITKTVVDAWSAASHAAGLSLTCEVESDCVVRADPNAIERIVANLVSNAIKFTPRGGSVHVRVGCEHPRAVLEVRDTGPGIDADLWARLFGRFERGANAKAGAIGGSGLGLSVVKELAEDNGGTVGVENLAGGGARFHVELPLADVAPAATNGAPMIHLRPDDYGVPSAETELPSVYEPDGTPRATILLAEDDSALRDRTAKVLSDRYRVLAAPDGIAALELANVHAPDLLITDIAMPKMDGFELTKRFRALPQSRMAPVILLTTFGGIGDKVAGFEAGAVDWVQKPFEPAELRARVKSQLALRALALQLLESEKLAALGTLSAGLAHEIRNPANGIINAVGPLRELLPPEAIAPETPAGQLLDVIEHCSRTVASLARELLGFKRGASLDSKPVSLETLLRRVKATSTHALDGVELRERFDYRGSVRCAEPLLAQVLTNLLENGAHAAGRGGWVELRTGLESERVVIEVADSGPGIAPELRERIFEPFFTTKPAGKGNGLGLPTAREIALRHGGSLEVRSSANGTVFRLELPVDSFLSPIQ